MTEATPQIVRIPCSNCGGAPRNHSIVAEYKTGGGDDEIGFYWSQLDQVCRCQGCDSVRFRRVEYNSEDEDYNGNPIETVTIFPDTKTRHHKLQPELVRLGKVGQIYRETVAAVNAEANTLAGGGLRAIVEAVCNDKGIKGKDLQAKIDGLVTANLLAKPQADLLHEERYIGNYALHELQAPSESELSAGLDIVETLLKTIYILPQKAEQLRKARIKP